MEPGMNPYVSCVSHISWKKFSRPMRARNSPIVKGLTQVSEQLISTSCSYVLSHFSTRNVSIFIATTSDPSSALPFYHVSDSEVFSCDRSDLFFEELREGPALAPFQDLGTPLGG